MRRSLKKPKNQLLPLLPSHAILSRAKPLSGMLQLGQGHEDVFASVPLTKKRTLSAKSAPPSTEIATCVQEAPLPHTANFASRSPPSSPTMRSPESDICVKCRESSPCVAPGAAAGAPHETSVMFDAAELAEHRTQAAIEYAAETGRPAGVLSELTVVGGANIAPDATPLRSKSLIAKVAETDPPFDPRPKASSPSTFEPER